MANKDNGSAANPEVENNAPKIKKEASEKLKAKTAPVSPKVTAKPAKKKKKAKKARKAAKEEKSSRTFPTLTVEESLKVARDIRDNNGGKPCAGSDLKDITKTYNTNKLHYLSSASVAYSFTNGTFRKDKVEITALGEEAVYPKTDLQEKHARIKGFLKVEDFKRLLEHFNGKQLEDTQFLRNLLLKDYHIPNEFHDEFIKIFNKNIAELGISSGNPLEETTTADGKPIIRIVGQPTGENKTTLKAFVIMPFLEKNDKRPIGFFKEVLDSLIVPAGVLAGFKVETAKVFGSDIIQSTIVNELLDADLVIADLTDHNPNVLFELGLRMAKDKPIALIKTADTGVVFDVDNMLRVQPYNQNLWKTTVEKDIPLLTEHIKAAWDNRNDSQTYLKILQRAASAPTIE